MDLINSADTCPGNLQGTSATLFLALLNTLIAAKCNLANPNDYPEDYGPKLKDGEEFDFIVVGAGSAGSVVANKLSENGKWKVLVIEAGGYPTATSDIPGLAFNIQNTEIDWSYKIQRDNHTCLGFKNKECPCPKGKVLGGSSTLNLMLYVKGNKGDYDQWADMGNEGWDWDSIKGYFTEIERVLPPGDEDTSLGINGILNLTKIINNEPVKVALQEGLRELGIPYIGEQNPEQPIGSVDIPLCVDKGTRSNVGKEILGAVKDRSNLYVAMHALVQKITIDSENKIAQGVEVKIGDEIIKVKASKEVVVSSGSINSPQLLMLSGIGPADQLKEHNISIVQDLPVGQFLQDHLIFFGFMVALDETALNSPSTSADPLYEYFMHHSGTLSTISVSSFLSFQNFKNNSMWPNWGYHFMAFPPHNVDTFSVFQSTMNFNDDIAKAQMEACKKKVCLWLIPTMLDTKSSGKILLKSKNPEEYPLIYSGYLSDKEDQDVEVVIEAIRFSEKLIETELLKKYNPQLIRLPLPECDHYEYQSDQYWNCSAHHLGTTIYHSTSTCRMGHVVDSRLRVQGMKNLRVADASIMPEIVTGNTHAATMMIGLKASEMIKEDWNSVDEL